MTKDGKYDLRLEAAQAEIAKLQDLVEEEYQKVFESKRKLELQISAMEDQIANLNINYQAAKTQLSCVLIQEAFIKRLLEE